MKTRKNFVSNSSSSSFVIAAKTDDLKSYLNQFAVDKKNPFSPLISEAIKIFTNNLACYTSIEQFKSDNGIDDDEFEEGYYKHVPYLIEKFGKFYTGRVSSEEGGLEEGLRDLCFNLDEEDFYFRMEG